MWGRPHNDPLRGLQSSLPEGENEALRVRPHRPRRSWTQPGPFPDEVASAEVVWPRSAPAALAGIIRIGCVLEQRFPERAYVVIWSRITIGVVVLGVGVVGVLVLRRNRGRVRGTRPRASWGVLSVSVNGSEARKR